MKDKLHTLVLFGGLFVIVSLVISFVAVFWYYTIIAPKEEKAYYRQNPNVQLAEHSQYLKTVETKGIVDRSLIIIVPATMLSVGILLFIGIPIGFYRLKAKKAAVHGFEIGKHNKFVVHENDLSIAAPLAMGLMTGQQLRETNTGQEKAFEFYTKMAEVQTKQIQALKPHAPAQPTQIDPAHINPGAFPQIVEHLTHPDRIPSFQQLLDTGELARGKPMILGYENGVPRRGSFLDIYSAAVAGESGSGKTATLLFLIGSALISMPVHFLGIDPHYPHPKSLGYKLTPLWKAGLMQMATYKDDMLKVLKHVERTIDNRLKQHDTDETPVVLVIDELAFLSTTSIGGNIARTMERISMEGRKCAVYLLASSQTWLTAKTGNSSTVRDTLTSAYVHRIKPKQANLLLQDKEETDKVKKHVKHAGEALLVPVNDESVLVKMPFTTHADLQTVADMLKERKKGNGHKQAIPSSSQRAFCEVREEKSEEYDQSFDMLVTPDVHGVTGTARVTDTTDTTDNEALTPEICKQKREAQKLSYRKLAERTGLTDKKEIACFATKINRYELRKGHLTDDERHTVTAAFETENFPKKDEPRVTVTTPYIQ